MPEIRLDGEKLLKWLEAIEHDLNTIRRMAGVGSAPASSVQGVDLTRIKWKGKGSTIASVADPWAWAFAYDQQGEYTPASKALVQAIEQYGKVVINGFEMTLGGRDKRLLNRKKLK